MEILNRTEMITDAYEISLQMLSISKQQKTWLVFSWKRYFLCFLFEENCHGTMSKLYWTQDLWYLLLLFFYWIGEIGCKKGH